MKIVCPKCQASLRVISDEPGEVHGCPKCGASFRSPERPSPQPTLPSSTEITRTIQSETTVSLTDLDDLNEIPLAANADAYEFTVDCPLCATRMDFDDSRIGTLAVCVDCHHPFTITPPSPQNRRRPLEKELAAENREERIAIDNPDRPPATLTAQQTTKNQAADILARAARELEAEREYQKRRGFDDQATHNFFAFVRLPETLARFVVLALVGCVAVLAQTRLSVELQQPQATFMTLLMWCIGSTAGVGWFIALACHAFALLRATANGGLTVDDWPSELGEILQSALQVAAAFFYASIPGLCIALLLFSPSQQWPFFVMLLMLSTYLLFPLTMGSILEQNSIFSPYSSNLVTTLQAAPQECKFFALAAAVPIVIFGMVTAALSLHSYLLVIPIALGQLITTLFYFRVLGWLLSQAWQTSSTSE
ncbi:MAG: hypothetical protein ACKPEY_05535 [Planctomycetota bacterium]